MKGEEMSVWRSTVKPDCIWHVARFQAGPLEFELTVREGAAAMWSVTLLSPVKHLLKRDKFARDAAKGKQAAGEWLSHLFIQAAASAALTANGGNPMIQLPSAWKTDSDRAPE